MYLSKRSNGVYYVGRKLSSYHFYRERYEDSKTEVNKATLEMVEYADGFIATYQTIVKQESDVKETMDRSGLAGASLFSAIHR